MSNQEPSDTASNENTQGGNEPAIDALEQIKNIKNELERLNSHKLITAYNSISKLLFFQFMKGTAFGLGTLFGASLVVSLLIFLLSQVEFIPIIGDVIKDVLSELKQVDADP